MHEDHSPAAVENRRMTRAMRRNANRHGRWTDGRLTKSGRYITRFAFVELVAMLDQLMTIKLWEGE